VGGIRYLDGVRKKGSLSIERARGEGLETMNGVGFWGDFVGSRPKVYIIYIIRH